MYFPINIAQRLIYLGTINFRIKLYGAKHCARGVLFSECFKFSVKTQVVPIISEGEPNSF